MANKTCAADSLIRSSEILPDSNPASHVKTAKNPSKTAMNIRTLANAMGTN
jgi:hypothetical protein